MVPEVNGTGIACMHLSCFSHVRYCATLWTINCQAPLTLGLSRQEYWSGLPVPPPGDLPDPGIEPTSPALTGRFSISAIWKAPGQALGSGKWEVPLGQVGKIPKYLVLFELNGIRTERKHLVRSRCDMKSLDASRPGLSCGIPKARSEEHG